MNRWLSGLISQRLQLVQRTLLLALALVLGLVVFAPAAARAAGPNCTVNGAGGANYTTIQAAVDDTGCTTISHLPQQLKLRGLPGPEGTPSFGPLIQERLR